jgi:hypothetical protein
VEDAEEAGGRKSRRGALGECLDEAQDAAPSNSQAESVVSGDHKPLFRSTADW